MVVVKEVTRAGEPFEPDDIQKLAYKLTHMYYNWPGTVRVPAPCQVDNVLKLDFIQSKMPTFCLPIYIKNIQFHEFFPVIYNISKRRQKYREIQA